jgi:hypothetical protein
VIKQMKAMRFALFEFIKGAQNNIITPSQSSAQAYTLHTQTKHALIALTVTICAYVTMYSHFSDVGTCYLALFLRF